MDLIDVRDTTLAISVRGGGPLALFVHGFPLDRRLWLEVAASLADLRRCVAVDLRGFGASAPTSLPALTMELLADDLAALVRELGAEAADVVALSMGGYAAFALWERHPEVVGSLALLGTRAQGDGDAVRAARRAQSRETIEKGRGWLCEQLAPRLMARSAGVLARARLRTMIEATPYETIVAAQAGMAARADRTALLPTLRVPTLVAVGAEDATTPLAEVRALSEAIPGAELAIVPGAGHLLPLEAPDAVAAALRRFWGGGQRQTHRS